MIGLMLAAAVHTVAAPASQTTSICSALVSQIDAAQAQTSNLAADEIGDDSAPRATQRSARASALMLEVSNNLTLMAAHRCAPYPHTIDLEAYETGALQCGAAIRKDVEAHVPGGLSSEAKAACDRNAWKRSE